VGGLPVPPAASLLPCYIHSLRTSFCSEGLASIGRVITSPGKRWRAVARVYHISPDPDAISENPVLARRGVGLEIFTPRRGHGEGWKGVARPRGRLRPAGKGMTRTYLEWGQHRGARRECTCSEAPAARLTRRKSPGALTTLVVSQYFLAARPRHDHDTMSSSGCDLSPRHWHDHRDRGANARL
jgi:hypothetical protein